MSRKKNITPARIVYDKALKNLGLKHADVMKIIAKDDVGFLSYPSLLMLLRRGTCNPYYPTIIERILNIPSGELVTACAETRSLYTSSIVVDIDVNEESDTDVRTD